MGIYHGNFRRAYLSKYHLPLVLHPVQNFLLATIERILRNFVWRKKLNRLFTDSLPDLAPIVHG